MPLHYLLLLKGLLKPLEPAHPLVPPNDAGLSSDILIAEAVWRLYPEHLRTPPHYFPNHPKSTFLHHLPRLSLLLYRPGLPMRPHANLLVASHFLYPSRFVPPNPLLK